MNWESKNSIFNKNLDFVLLNEFVKNIGIIFAYLISGTHYDTQFIGSGYLFEYNKNIYVVTCKHVTEASNNNPYNIFLTIILAIIKN